MRLMTGVVVSAVVALLATGCSPRADAGTTQAEAASQSLSTDRPGNGQAYAIKDTQVWTVPDPVSGRIYQIYVSLPANYDPAAARRYPVLYATDADYAFPVVRALSRRVGDRGDGLEDFILVGLSYAQGDDAVASRNRDYTPTARPGSQGLHGEAEAYRVYIRDHVFPFVESHFRTDPARRLFLGHSYGALLGAHVLFTEPAMFRDYILGSPSFWFARKHMFDVEARYAESHRDLPAHVYMYIGEYEAPRPSTSPPSTPRYSGSADMVGDVQAFEQRLKARHYPSLTIRSEVIAEEDHLTVAPSGATRGLMEFLPPKKAR